MYMSMHTVFFTIGIPPKQRLDLSSFDSSTGKVELGGS